jgi:hypothetical protein
MEKVGVWLWLHSTLDCKLSYAIIREGSNIIFVTSSESVKDLFKQQTLKSLNYCHWATYCIHG